MNYSHHFAIETTSDRYAEAWPRLIVDIGRILSAVAALGVILSGPNGHGAPVVDPARHIAFAGGTTTDPLNLPAPASRPVGVHVVAPAVGTCRTRLDPYDLAVAAVLLRCHMLAGDAAAIRSTGRWDDEWLHGVRPGQPGARILIRRLFGAEPAVTPLAAGAAAGAMYGGAA